MSSPLRRLSRALSAYTTRHRLAFETFRADGQLMRSDVVPLKYLFVLTLSILTLRERSRVSFRHRLALEARDS